MEVTNKVESFRLHSNTTSSFHTRRTESADVKPDLDRELNEKVGQIKQIYETRVRSLNDNLKQIYELVQNDQLINTMKQDSSTIEFANHRVKEILDQFLNSEREHVVEKLSTQYALIKGEYQKLQAEFSRLESSTHERAVDLERRYVELEETLRQEKKDKEFYFKEAGNLKARINELCEYYDDAIERKDAQLTHRTEREVSEFQFLKMKMAELENELKQKESELYDLNSERETFKTVRDADRIALNKLENDLKLCKRVAADYEAQYNDCKSKLKSQNELVSSLKMEISKLENNRFDLEERMAQKEQEYQIELANEQEVIKQNISRLKDKYKSKIQKYKAKFVEYKEKIAEKDQTIYEIKKKINQQTIFQQNNEEVLRQKAEELRDLYEKKLEQQEEEFRSQQRELIGKNEEQIQELQVQFQRLLDSKLAACRKDAQGQIDSLRRTERDFPTMVENKTHISEREYIKIAFHEERLREKQTLIDKLKSEIRLRETELRDEMASKLKVQEDKLRKELELSDMNAKMTITQLENQISTLHLEGRRFENELNIARENNLNLQLRIQDLEGQYKKLLESLEDWEYKGKELNRLYEDESSQRKEMESELRAANLDLQEMREVFNETKSGLSERMDDIKSLSEQNEGLREEITKERSRASALQKELEELKAERNVAEVNRLELIKSLKEQNDALRRDNRELNQIMLDALKSEKERYEREVKEHFKTKSELKEAQNKLQGARQSDSGAEAHIEKLESKLVDQEIDIEKLRQKLQQLDLEKQRLVKEYQDLKKRYYEQGSRFKDFKAQVQLLMTGRIRILKGEMNDLRESSQKSIQEFEEEFYSKFGSFVCLIKDQVLRKELQMSGLLDLERMKINESYHEKLSSIKDSFEQEQTHLVESLEKKLDAKEKEVLCLRNDILSLNLQNQRYEEESEKFEQRKLELENEVRNSHRQYNSGVKEKENIKKKHEHLDVKYKEDAEFLSLQLKHIQAENEEQRSQLLEQHDVEVRELKSRIESLQGRLERMVSRQEEQLRVSENAHRDEILRVRAEYEGKIEKLDANIDDLETMNREKFEKMKQLQETISQLQKDNNAIRVSYQTQLDRYETKLEELTFKVQVGGENAQQLRYEQAGETEALHSQIRKLQEELTLRNERITTLVNERNKAQDKVRELERKTDESERFGLLLNTTENSHQNIFKSYRNSIVDLKSNEENFSEFSEYDSQLSRSVQGLKKIEKYLESKRGSVRSPLTEFKDNEFYGDQNERNDAKPRRL